MENRERDKMSKNTGSTEAGDLNRSTSERKGSIESDSSADFGQNIGRSENWDSEPSRRSGNVDSDIDNDIESDSGSSLGSSSSERGGSVGVGDNGSGRRGRGSDSPEH
jgi:hypothetical protein